MISHDRAEFLISESLDAPLTPADQQALAAHLAGCSGCRRFADQLGAAVARIHAIPQLPASPVVTRGVLERIDDGPPSFAWLRRGGLFLGSPAVAAAGAVALVAALAGTIYLAVNPGMDPNAEPRATISAVALAPADATATAEPTIVAAPKLAPTEAPVIAAAPPTPTQAPEPTAAPEVMITVAPQPTATARPRPTEPPKPTATETAEPAVRRAAPGEATRPPQPTAAAVAVATDAAPVPTEAPQIAMAQEAPPAVDAAPEIAQAGAPVASDAQVSGAEPVYDQPAVHRDNGRKDQGAGAAGGNDNNGGNDGRDRNRGNDNGDNGDNGDNRGRGQDGSGNGGGGNRGDGGNGGAPADPGADPVTALVEENLGTDQAYDPAAAPPEDATPAPEGDPAADPAWAAEPAPVYDENGQPIIVPAEGAMPGDQVIEPVPGEGDSSISVDPSLIEDPQSIEPVQPEGGDLVEEQAVPQEQPADPSAALPASDIGSAPVIGAGVPGLDPTIAPDGSVLTVAPDAETGAPTAAWIDPASGEPVPFEPSGESHVDTPVGWAAGAAYYQRVFGDGRVELRAGTPGGGGFLLWSGQDGGPFGSGLGSARLTPGGDRIAFLANGGLFVAPTADPNAGVQLPVGNIVGYDWSPAGDRLAVSDGYTVSVFDAYGNGPLIAVGNQGGIPIGAIDWREDGIAVARFDTGEMILFPI